MLAGTQNLNANALLPTVVKLELPRGMRDLESEEFYNIDFVRRTFFETAALFNFRLMEPSPIELLSTLEAKSGSAILNDVYGFKDKGGRDMALRFDLTVGLTRYVAARRDLKLPFKVAAFAGVWRYDEPQAGRYRYFHQWDIEVYGPFKQESDAEVIEFVSTFFKRLGLEVIIDINSRQLVEEYIRKILGVPEDKTVMEMFRAIDKVPKKGAQAVLLEYKERLDQSKLQALINLSELKGTAESISTKTDASKLPSWTALEDLISMLRDRKVENVRINLGIVRGLDYYSGIVFEAFDPLLDIGALVGGGRYDVLAGAFGRSDIGATGVAGGVERIVMALRKHEIMKQVYSPLVYVAYAQDDSRKKAMQIVSGLRRSGISTDYDLSGRALRKQLDDSASKRAKITVIVTAEDLNTGQVTIRLMEDGREDRYPIDGLVSAVRNLLESRAT
jgi:histidyl-tRNA synthetase